MSEREVYNYYNKVSAQEMLIRLIHDIAKVSRALTINEYFFSKGNMIRLEFEVS